MAQETKGTALVTGASGGIGAVYAERLARRGYDLVLVARREDRLRGLAADITARTGRSVEVLAADLAAAAGMAAVAERLAGDGAITMLVNNAGTVLRGGLMAATPEETERVIALNVTAPTLLAGAAGRAFAARGAGTIVNIASVVAFIPEQFEGVYSATKAYVLNLSRSLAATLAASGVHVQAVLPGPVRTEIWDHAGVDIDAAMPGQVMAVGDLVDAALTGLELGETVTIPPLAEDGLWQAHEASRHALQPHLSRRDPAARYGVAATAA